MLKHTQMVVKLYNWFNCEKVRHSGGLTERVDTNSGVHHVHDMLIFAFSQLSAQRSKHFPGLLKLLWRFCLSVASERRAETPRLTLFGTASPAGTGGQSCDDFRKSSGSSAIGQIFRTQQTHDSGLRHQTPEMPQGGIVWQFGKEVGKITSTVVPRQGKLLAGANPRNSLAKPPIGWPFCGWFGSTTCHRYIWSCKS